MRLLSSTQRTEYTVNDERVTPSMNSNDLGEALPDATKWFFRPLTSKEEGILQDALFDMGGLSVKNAGRKGQGGEDVADVDMRLSVSPSQQRERRIRMSLVGWENLIDEDGNEIKYKEEVFHVQGNQMKGAPGAVLELLPNKYLSEFDSFIRTLSTVTVAQGNG